MNEELKLFEELNEEIGNSDIIEEFGCWAEADKLENPDDHR